MGGVFRFSWPLAWVMDEICSKDSNELKYGKCLALCKHLGAGGYNYHHYSLGWSEWGRDLMPQGCTPQFLSQDADWAPKTFWAVQRQL